jgi:hypothetical protein
LFGGSLLYADELPVRRFTGELERLRAKESLSEQQLLDAKAKMDAAKAEMDEALARLVRVRKQKDSLRSRGLEMARRNAESLDALESLEREESEAATDAISWGAFGVVDWSVTDLVSPDALLAEPSNRDTGTGLLTS